MKELNIYMICNNRQIKNYSVKASRKFSIKDETYIIKKECCYLKRIQENGRNRIVECSYYIEGNPCPFDLKNIKNNTGLNSKELDMLIGGDIFNILLECQKQDRSKYMLNISVMVLILGAVNFLGMLF